MFHRRSRSFLPLVAVTPLEARRLLASFVVSTTADDGLGSLRQAVADANASVDADTITFDTAGVFASPQMITLTTGPLVLTDAMMTTVTGSAAMVTVSGGNASGIFQVSEGASLSLEHMTMTGGMAERGPAVANSAGTLSMVDCVVTGNTATVEGGGVSSVGGTTSMVGCTVTNNTAPISGGVLAVFGTVTLTDCTVSNNHSTASDSSGFGGGITAVVTKLHILSSTISGNSSAFSGGGIGSFSSTLTVTNSTVSGNWAVVEGGGIAVLGTSGKATLVNSTVTLNTGGGVSKTTKPVLTINNSVVAGQVSGVNVSGTFAGASNFIGGNPMLGPLANNGGPTMTHAVMPGSPLLNTGNNALALDRFGSPLMTDQRGVGSPRVFDGLVDIGAFEFNVPPNTPPTTSGIADVTVIEDAANTVVNLHNHFNDAEDGPAGLIYSVVGNTNASLFASVAIDSAGILTLDYAANTSGVANITIRATDSKGEFVQDTFAVTVLARPTTSGIPGLTTTEDAPNTTINLRSRFNDAEDGPAGLIYSVMSNSNAALFASVSIDAAGMLVLDYAANANGVANITVRATDTAGAYVDATFTVTVKSVAQQQQTLQQQVQSLPGLNGGNVNSLLSKLALKGNSGDAGKLQSFLSALQDMMSGGKVAQSTGNMLLDAARALLTSLV